MNQYNPFEVATSVDVATEPAGARVYGGMRRLPYFGYLFGGYVITALLQFGLFAALTGGMAPGAGSMWVLILPGAVYQILAIWVTAKRLQNQGYSGWWVLGLIVPILNIAVSVKCIAAPEGYADHKTLDTSGKVVVGLLLAAIVLTVAALALT
ncbi:MAG: DUF805 domain-containing protein [Planctomyces sp.]